MTERGPALVRTALLSLVLASLALALLQPAAQAGTPDAPEVQDPQGDVTVTSGTIPPQAPLLAPASFAAIDVLKGYVGANNTTVHVTLEMAGAPSTHASAKYNATFKVVTGTTTTNSSVQRLGTAVTGPAGVAVTVTGNLLNFTFPTASLGIVAGSRLTNLTIATALSGQSLRVAGQADVPVPQDDQSGTDTAGPSAISFTFKGPAAGDSDGDGLPDACETQHFGGLTSNATAAGDADKDGLTNGQECALGTDPNDADSDNDGRNDKDDPFPTDPTRGGTSSSGSGSRSGSGSASGSGSGSGSRSGTETGTDKGEVRNLGDAVERLKDDPGYLLMSSGGFLTVLLLAILALAVRWSL